MTTDEIQLLRDFRRDVPAPDEETMRRAYAYATSQAPAARRLPLRLPATNRGKILGIAAVAGAATLAPAVAFSGLLSSSSAPQSSPPNPVLTTRPPAVRTPLGFSPIALQLTRSGQRVTSIDVTVNAPTREATMQLQVLRGSPYGPDSNRTVVFQEQVPMTEIASPANGPSGTVALSTWSGTLAPSDWRGGCQNAFYTVKAVAGIQTTEAAWFRCSGG